MSDRSTSSLWNRTEPEQSRTLKEDNPDRARVFLPQSLPPHIHTRPAVSPGKQLCHQQQQQRCFCGRLTVNALPPPPPPLSPPLSCPPLCLTNSLLYCSISVSLRCSPIFPLHCSSSPPPLLLWLSAVSQSSPEDVEHVSKVGVGGRWLHRWHAHFPSLIGLGGRQSAHASAWRVWNSLALDVIWLASTATNHRGGSPSAAEREKGGRIRKRRGRERRRKEVKEEEEEEAGVFNPLSVFFYYILQNSADVESLRA